MLVTAALITSCATDNNSSSTDNESATRTATASAAATVNAPNPTLTASSLQPPPQKQYGRPGVVYDPCTWIPDDVIAGAGFDPGTRSRPGDQIAEITFLICRFKSKPRTLSVLSGNATWDEDLQKNRSWSEPLTVNGREAMWVRDPGLGDGCAIDLRTKVGVISVMSTLTLNGLSQNLQPCDGLLDIATAIEPTIGKDN
ncbi:DUF3558 domain-containing protein [Nocardia sp. N2S4-5]|uniref:DUF3558 domain-containing protein n=1 Tax=Nocardia sp. N2S4-5 TaxID=3351565 RepID=UPI0037D93D0B